jgi:hypothetical protein
MVAAAGCSSAASLHDLEEEGGERGCISSQLEVSCKIRIGCPRARPSDDLPCSLRPASPSMPSPSDPTRPSPPWPSRSGSSSGKDEEGKTYKIWSRPPPCFTSSSPLAARSLHRHATPEGGGRRPPVLIPTGQRQSEETSRRLGFLGE